MAIRTYTAASIINFVNNLVNTEADPWAITATAFNSVTLTISVATANAFGVQAFGNVQGSIDGDIDFTQFPTIPAGAKINRLKIRYAISYASDATATANPPGGSSTSEIDLLLSSLGPYSITPQTVLQSDTTLPTSAVAANLVVSLATSEIVYDFSGEPLGYLPLLDFIALATPQSISILGKVFGDASNAGGTGCTETVNGTFILSNWEFEVTYNEAPFQWHIVDAGTPKKVGDLLVIEGVGPGPHGLDTVIEVNFGDCIVPSIDFYHQSPSLLIVYIPFCLHDFTGPITPALTGDGRIWSDPIPVEPITIFFENGSGIYTIITGKITDTVYDPSRDGTTDEVKIPDPYARTGFIDG